MFFHQKAMSFILNMIRSTLASYIKINYNFKYDLPRDLELK